MELDPYWTLQVVCYSLLDATMLLDKVVDELCCVLVLQLILSDINGVQQALPFW